MSYNCKYEGENMNLGNKYATDLTSKDKEVALAAAKHIIDKPDMEAWKCFVENSDNIFDFIKQNIAKHFAQVIDENNYKNLFQFFKIHSFDWDECFVQILLRFSYANEELTEKMLDMIQNGSEDEKAYAAKYFSFIPNEQANYYLFNAYAINYEPLKYNAAKALGDAGDVYSYEYFTNKLSSSDDWEKIDAAQFLQWYGNKKAYVAMLRSMSDSSMPEHIAGSVAMLDSLSKHFVSSEKNIRDLSLDCYQHLIDSLAEIWPLSTIIDFEIDSCVETLIGLINENADKQITSRYAALLLQTKHQFETFFYNDEYKFNEDKTTISAMENILELLNEGSEAFWQDCKVHLGAELQQENSARISFALEVIANFNLIEYIPEIKSMLQADYSEEVIYELLLTLDKFADFANINKYSILNKVQDYNLKALIEKLIP